MTFSRADIRRFSYVSRTSSVPIFSVCWEYGWNKTDSVSTKPPARSEVGDRGSSRNVRKPSHPDSAEYLRKFRWILSPRGASRHISAVHLLVMSIFGSCVPYLTSLELACIWTISRVQSKYDSTRWRTGREVKGKRANVVDSQYPSHYLGTWCIQRYYRWCAHLGCQ